MSLSTTKDKPYGGVDPNASITENNTRWTAVDQYSFPHLHNSSNPHHASIEHALQTSLDQGLEDIAVAPSQGKFLAVQCQLVGAKRILEIGTLGAYSTIWMGSSSPDVQITSIEIDERTAAIARENIKFAGMEDRIEVVVGSALEILPRIAKDVEEGKMDRFDFSFIDADKAESLDYFKWAVKLSNKKACIYLDNMVRKGFLANEELAQTDRNIKGIRRAVEEIGKMDSVEAVVIQTVSEKNYDGFLMAVVK